MYAISCFRLAGDSYNVMTTRSGLVIPTMPTARCSSSRCSASSQDSNNNGGNTASHSGTVTGSQSQSSTDSGGKCGSSSSSFTLRQNNYDSLSFVTRFHLIRKGIAPDEVGKLLDRRSHTQHRFGLISSLLGRDLHQKDGGLRKKET